MYVYVVYVLYVSCVCVHLKVVYLDDARLLFMGESALGVIRVAYVILSNDSKVYFVSESTEATIYDSRCYLSNIPSKVKGKVDKVAHPFSS